tara:strand:- start:83 stop:265 length:183 start_codon:yes stop_codon:yes gene_type:complete
MGRKINIDVATKDPSKFHFYVSLAKSGVRIAAGVALCMGSFFLSGLLFVAAEVLGIVEEL